MDSVLILLLHGCLADISTVTQAKSAIFFSFNQGVKRLGELELALASGLPKDLSGTDFGQPVLLLESWSLVGCILCLGATTFPLAQPNSGGMVINGGQPLDYKHLDFLVLIRDGLYEMILSLQVQYFHYLEVQFLVHLARYCFYCQCYRLSEGFRVHYRWLLPVTASRCHSV
ncbi:MAG: hypothetical protein EZS28_012304 [Streblomastix strix]|uniref:Uncharacterized protein n=1 Tax=Streblomastix strix TaxID=222440 RepID=A0A5J4WCW0_9EUKA|nr:MAG: hypothetical protein EZS28_012304 [Streblomastix strix]